MNWMIDGAQGDLYRRAMGYPALTPATDEWEAERRLGSRRRTALSGRLARLFAKFTQSFATDDTVTLSPKEGFLS